GIQQQRQRADEVDDQEQRRDQSRCGESARKRKKDQRRAETGKAAGRAGNEADQADCERGVGADVGGDELGQAHAFIWRMSENRFALFGIIRAGRRLSFWSPLPRSSLRRRRSPRRSWSSHAAAMS